MSSSGHCTAVTRCVFQRIIERSTVGKGSQLFTVQVPESNCTWQYESSVSTSIEMRAGSTESIDHLWMCDPLESRRSRLQGGRHSHAQESLGARYRCARFLVGRLVPTDLCVLQAHPHACRRRPVSHLLWRVDLLISSLYLITPSACLDHRNPLFISLIFLTLIDTKSPHRLSNHSDTDSGNTFICSSICPPRIAELDRYWFRAWPRWERP